MLVPIHTIGRRTGRATGITGPAVGGRASSLLAMRLYGKYTIKCQGVWNGLEGTIATDA